MRSTAWNDALILSFAEFIDSPAVLETFQFLVGHAQTLPGFRVEPKMHGLIKTLIYIDFSGKKQPFSVVINRKSLLFYVRKPGIPLLLEGVDGLHSNFPKANENPSGEQTICLDSLADAILLVRYLFNRTAINQTNEKRLSNVPTGQSNMSIIKVPAAIVRQGDLTLFTTSFKVRDLIVPGFYSVETLDPDNATDSGYQRLLNTARAKRLADYMNRPGFRGGPLG